MTPSGGGAVQPEPADKVINNYYILYYILSNKHTCILICTVELIIRVSCHLRLMELQDLDATAAVMLMEHVNASSFSRWSEIGVC